MRTTIDAAGRIVVPKALRDEFGLSSPQEVEIELVDGSLEISVPPTPMKLERRHGITVLVPADGRELPPLTDEQVRETLERIRR